MIDLRNTCILVRTPEENEMLLKEAEKQGFHWFQKDGRELLQKQHFPDILKFYGNKDMTYEVSFGPDFDFYEASKLFGAKEMTAREFLKKIIKLKSCYGRSCEKCILSEMNTKNAKSMCNLSNWKQNDIDYLIELANTKDPIYHPPMDNTRAALCIDDILGKIDRCGLNEEEEKALKYAAEKLREVEE